MVLKLWEGLGYYSRARNLHVAAKTIVAEMNGVFPHRYKDILSLKGVGPYTAAAIASFAFKLPYAVVDGNVIRVLSRYFGITEPVDNAQVLKKIKALAQDLLNKEKPDVYNQAIMNFGAMVCLPRNPHCSICPMATSCYAHANGMVADLPFKEKKIKKTKRAFDYHIYHDDARVLIHRRENDDIWKGLYEFVLDEHHPLNPEILLENKNNSILLRKQHRRTIGPISHILTHRKIIAHFHFYVVVFNPDIEYMDIDPFYLVEKKKLSTFAFPRLIQKSVIDGIDYFK
jgi:A/G-specific adenine glycosylase